MTRRGSSRLHKSFKDFFVPLGVLIHPHQFRGLKQHGWNLGLHLVSLYWALIVRSRLVHAFTEQGHT